jgi:hypothetical protein
MIIRAWSPGERAGKMGTTARRRTISGGSPPVRQRNANSRTGASFRIHCRADPEPREQTLRLPESNPNLPEVNRAAREPELDPQRTEPVGPNLDPSPPKENRQPVHLARSLSRGHSMAQVSSGRTLGPADCPPDGTAQSHAGRYLHRKATNPTPPCRNPRPGSEVPAQPWLRRRSSPPRWR